RVTVSSDGGGCLPVFNDQGEITEMDIGRPSMLMQTLQDLLQAGAALQAVLPAFTSNVAALLRLHDRGHVEPGRQADLVVLGDSDCIDDVMVAGIWHVRGGSQQVYGQFERQEQR
ncbi:MAG TPA: amidohydrolase family protein, partial [Woeseiaceae bacterium]|nr:amidohydrolase family protein [Woeseiaceae bacterium]